MSAKRRKQKPLFKKKSTPAKKAIRVLMTLVLVAVLIFLGYSIGKPIVEFFEGREANVNSSDDPVSELPDVSQDVSDTQPTSAPDEVTTQPSVVTEPEAVKNGILYVSFDPEFDLTEQLDSAIKTALSEGYKGLCLDLVAEGGRVMFGTANEVAVKSEAVISSPIDLSYCVRAISEAELLPYARISALSDHIASWFDRSLCYLFEDGSSKWLDNSIANGGKPWISPFSDNAKEYVSSFVTEISDAGFAGIIAGEFEFPPFRTKDLGYIGKTVQDPNRYEALAGFSNVLGDALGSAKFYAVEVNAEDILSGECELLTDPELLNSKTVYIKYDSEKIGDRIEKADGSVVSFEGLSEDYKIAQVYRLVNTALATSGLKPIAAVKSELPVSRIYTALESIGYSVESVIIY